MAPCQDIDYAGLYADSNSDPVSGKGMFAKEASIDLSIHQPKYLIYMTDSILTFSLSKRAKS